MSNPIQSLLSSFSSSSFHLDIPDWFVEQFFAQRRIITKVVEEYFDLARREVHQEIDNILLYDGITLFGQSTIEENYALHLLVELLRPKNVVEIGLFRGQTALTLNQALARVGSGSYKGIDISEETIQIVQLVLNKTGLERVAHLILGDSSENIANMGSIDFSFIDGDHNWPGVVYDVVGTYNKLEAGGVIAMHDVGTRAWGWTIQDPGRLLFEVLPNIIEGHASIYWLDSMCRQTTMRLLSPASCGENKYFSAFSESLETAKITMRDTINGWGGLGFIHKTDGDHQLDINQVLKLKPASFDIQPIAIQKPLSLVGKVARKIANKIP